MQDSSQKQLRIYTSTRRFGRSLSNSAAKVVKSFSWPIHSQRFCDAVDSLLNTQEG